MRGDVTMIRALRVTRWRNYAARGIYACARARARADTRCGRARRTDNTRACGSMSDRTLTRDMFTRVTYAQDIRMRSGADRYTHARTSSRGTRAARTIRSRYARTRVTTRRMRTLRHTRRRWYAPYAHTALRSQISTAHTRIRTRTNADHALAHATRAVDADAQIRGARARVTRNERARTRLSRTRARTGMLRAYAPDNGYTVTSHTRDTGIPPRHGARAERTACDTDADSRYAARSE